MNIPVAEIVAFIAPLLVKLRDKAGEEAGKQLGSHLFAPLTAIQNRLFQKKPLLKESIEAVQAHPNDADYAAALRVELKELLANDPELLAEIAQLKQQTPQPQTSATLLAQDESSINIGDNALIMGPGSTYQGAEPRPKS